MFTVYVSGPLTCLPDTELMKNFYEQIGGVCSKLGLHPYIPHQHTDPVSQSDLSPRVVYQVDRHHIKQADLLIAYVGIPSIGVGQELEIAKQYGLPIILLYETGCRVTRMARGNPAVEVEITEPDRNSLLKELERILQQREENLTHNRKHMV